MPVIKKSLNLSKDHVQMSNLAAVTSTVFTRIVIGPLCDRYGPKVTMAGLLVLGAIPVLCVGLVNSWQGLVVLRAFIGILGGSFVMSQAWTTNMFKKRCIGGANAIVGGWGNLGGGSIQVIMVGIFAAVQSWGANEEKAWRLSFLFPGFALLFAAALTFAYGQDTPRVSKGGREGGRKAGMR
jgi:NNP family nitrate/nitrite transporter-like MFS transporter